MKEFWMKRRTRRETDTAVIRRRLACNRLYAVDRIESRFGLPVRFLAISLEGGGERIISRHRSEAAAMKSCQQTSRVKNVV